MEPSSFAQSFPFVPPDILCQFHRSRLIASPGQREATWNWMRLLNFHGSPVSKDSNEALERSESKTHHGNE